MQFKDSGTVCDAANYVAPGIDKIYRPADGSLFITFYGGRSP